MTTSKPVANHTAGAQCRSWLCDWLPDLCDLTQKLGKDKHYAGALLSIDLNKSNTEN